MSQEIHGLVKIAQVLKSNGTDGEIVIGTREISPEDINLKEPVFIYFDGLPVPFFIESLARRGNSKALVHLTDISSFEDSEEITGRGIYAERSSVEGIIDNEDSFSALVGWTLYAAGEEEDEEVGEITDFIDIPNNPCIEVCTEKGAVNIPLHEDLIISVDPENQEIIMDIPEGLLDL
ncbi:MAG: hypothetical protein K2J62_11565 [Bacteroidales bacterium]|nr:hypothetical protein [Bacteroidales bacterium]